MAKHYINTLKSAFWMRDQIIDAMDRISNILQAHLVAESEEKKVANSEEKKTILSTSVRLARLTNLNDFETLELSIQNSTDLYASLKYKGYTAKEYRVVEIELQKIIPETLNLAEFLEINQAQIDRIKNKKSYEIVEPVEIHSIQKMLGYVNIYIQYSKNFQNTSIKMKLIEL
jgi:hypothetical protein